MHRTLALMLVVGGASPVTAQTVEILNRPLIVAVGTGQATATPDYVRLGMTVRGEGATPAEALTALARERAAVEAGVRSVRGMRTAVVTSTALSNQDVRGPACAAGQPYQADQRLSRGDCAVIGAIATMGLEIKVSPAERAGDVASMAAQLGAKGLSLRGSGVENDDVLQREAAEEAVAEARRQAELMARASGGRLGAVLRVQEAGASYPAENVIVSGTLLEAPPNSVAANVPPPPPLAAPLPFAPQPVTRTARVTITFALDGAAPAR